MNILIKRSVIYLLLLISLTLLVSCNNQEKTNVLVVGTSADNPPFEFMKAGTIVGLDIDIIKAIGKHLGKDVEIRNMDFPGLLAALSNGKVDIVIAGIAPTVERRKQVDFSDIYLSTKMSGLFRAIDNIRSVADINNKIIAAQAGTTWEQFARSLSTKEQSNNRVFTLSNNIYLVNELKNAKVDIVILDNQQALNFVNLYPELASFVINGSDSDFAIALPKNSPLLNQINQAISLMKKEGELDAMIIKWIKFKS